MSKRKPARTRKARSASKVRVKAPRIQTAHHHQLRANSKQAQVLGLPRGRAVPPLRRSCIPSAVSRTPCVASWPPWCARNSGCGLSPRRQMASGSIGSLPAVMPTAQVSRVIMRRHSTDPAAIEAEIAHLRSLAVDARGDSGCWCSDGCPRRSEQGPAGSPDCRAPAGASKTKSRRAS
jgi:hypothetical protein